MTYSIGPLVPRWEGAEPSFVATGLSDVGVRYADKFWTRSGWVYKAVGDLHPPCGILAEPDWAPSRGDGNRNGYAKVRDYRWADGTAAERQYEFAEVPLYGRRYEVLPPAEIECHVIPEDATMRVIQDPRSPFEKLIAELLQGLAKAASIPVSAIGINGSHALGLAVEDSDVDLDVYGTEAVQAVFSTLGLLVATPESGWVRRWPPDRQTNLYYVWKAAYPDISLEWIYDLFEASGRDHFNFWYKGKRISIAYHVRPRNAPRPAMQSAQVVVLGQPTRYRARFIAQAEPGHLEIPAMFDVCDVTADELAMFTSAHIISFSKAFCYCREGDLVEFMAQERLGAQDPMLVIPSFGRSWPVRPVPANSVT